MDETTMETRRESHEAIVPEKSRRAALILEVLGDGKMTVDDIVNALIARGRITTFDRNFVAPRLTEMKDAGIIEVVGKKISDRSGKRIAVWAKVAQ